MKKRFYLSALLTTMLLNLTYAGEAPIKSQNSGWENVTLTDPGIFDRGCQYRFTLEGYPKSYPTYYATVVYDDTIYLTLPVDPVNSVISIGYTNKAKAMISNGTSVAVVQMQMKCD